MEWIRSHPYTTALSLSCLLIFVGTFIVMRRSQAPAPTGVSAWTGNVVPLDSTDLTGARQPVSQTVPPAATQIYGTGTLPYTQNVPVSDSQGTIPTGSGNGTFDLNTLLTQLSRPGATPTRPSSRNTDQIDVNAWDYIPAGLISTSSPPTTDRNPVQQALYTYGNEVGSLIQGFDATHPDQAQVATNALKDRQSTAKQAALARIGQDLEVVGQGIAEITDVPNTASVDNTALSQSFIDSGKKLIAMAQALPGYDAGLVSAIQAYDISITAYTKNFVALASLFSLSGVTFSSSDPGSAFSFTRSGL